MTVRFLPLKTAMYCRQFKGFRRELLNIMNEFIIKVNILLTCSRESEVDPPIIF